VAVSDEQIARINFLARKSKAEGLSSEERQEQFDLRRAYIDAVKASLTPLIESIRVVEVEETVEVTQIDEHTEVVEIHESIEVYGLEGPTDPASDA
jgi:uncharacterized protein YnzC (UPF0291/DUF896 family)